MSFDSKLELFTPENRLPTGSIHDCSEIAIQKLISVFGNPYSPDHYAIICAHICIFVIFVWPPALYGILIACLLLNSQHICSETIPSEQDVKQSEGVGYFQC